MSWSGFCRLMVGGAIGGALVVLAVILVIDPYDTVWFSPRFEREPPLREARYGVAGLARQDRFDSAIIGSSTARLLAPRHFDAGLGGRFVNLSINGAGPVQQARVLGLFVRHHQRPRTIVYAIDHWMWCKEQGESAVPSPSFPDALYDDDLFAMLPLLFTWRGFSAAGEQLAYLAGLRPPKWSRDGFMLYPPPSLYDPVRVHDNLYGKGGPPPFPPVTEPVRATAEERASWPFDTLPWLDTLLGLAPAETLKIVVLLPTHRVLLPPDGSLAAARLAECAARIGRSASAYRNAHAISFAKESPITRPDDQFWDTVHFTVENAERIQRLIVDGVRRRPVAPGLFDDLS